MEVTPEYKIALARELRRRQTESEACLWEGLRAHRCAGMGFRRQRPIGRFVADFCCERRRLVVEVDGEYHNDPLQREWDREREAHFTGRGYVVLRFSVQEVLGDTAKVLDAVAAAGRELPERW